MIIAKLNKVWFYFSAILDSKVILRLNEFVRSLNIGTFGIRVFPLFGKVAGRPSGEPRLTPPSARLSGRRILVIM